METRSASKKQVEQVENVAAQQKKKRSSSSLKQKKVQKTVKEQTESPKKKKSKFTNNNKDINQNNQDITVDNNTNVDEDDYENLADVNWETGKERYQQLLSEGKLDSYAKGTYLAVSSKGIVASAATRWELDPQIDESGEFSPYIICHLAKRTVMSKVAHGICNPAPLSVHRVANNTTWVQGALRDQTNTHPKNVNFMADDGSDISWIAKADVKKNVTQRGEDLSIECVHGQTEDFPTYKKYITIDGLRTKVDAAQTAKATGRIAGLDLIIRYKHVIDYTANPPRTWTKQPNEIDDV